MKTIQVQVGVDMLGFPIYHTINVPVQDEPNLNIRPVNDKVRKGSYCTNYNRTQSK